MPAASITEGFAANVKPPATGRETWTDEKLTGFALVVSASGGKVFYWVGRSGHSVTRKALAKYPAISVQQARKLCALRNGEVAAGIDHVEQRRTASRTLADVWEWHWTNCVDGQHRTSDRTRRDWLRLFADDWGRLPLSAITRPMIIELQTSLRNGTGDGPHPGAANTAVTLLRSLFKTAADNGWLTKSNPLAGITKDRLPSRERFILPEEVKRFFTSMKKLKQDYQDLFTVALFTGARRSNVLAMRWADIDSMSRVWTITHGEAKAGDAIRLPLSTLVEEILNRRFKARPDSQWVFPSNRGATGHMIEPKRQWARLLKDSGLTGLRMHDLRRTLGSWQALADVSLITIGKTLGHKTTAATAVYARLQDETARSAIQSANEAIQNAAGKDNSEKG